MKSEQQLQSQGNNWRLIQKTPRRFRENINHETLFPSTFSHSYSKEGVGMFIRDIGKYLPNYMASYHRKEKPREFLVSRNKYISFYSAFGPKYFLKNSDFVTAPICEE
jgi:hypothetical protein